MYLSMFCILFTKKDTSILHLSKRDMYVYIYVSVGPMYVCVHVCVYVCARVCMHVRMYISNDILFTKNISSGQRFHIWQLKG